jgi:hypothetical protein
MMPRRLSEREAPQRQFSEAAGRLIDRCIGLRSPNGHASFTRDVVIHVFENAIDVTERYERAGAF